jgi:hypothetical protein
MQPESIIISACITIFALGLFIVSLLSYRKHKNPKLIFVSLVFFVFLVRGILFSLSMFNQQIADILSMPYSWLVDLIILVLLFMATLKR